MILRNITFDFIRSIKNELQEKNLDQFKGTVDPIQPSIALEKLLDEEENKLVLKALHSLRKDFRQIIIMKHIYKIPYKKIAKDLGMSTYAVGEKLSRVRKIAWGAIQELKKKLEEPQ